MFKYKAIAAIKDIFTYEVVSETPKTITYRNGTDVKTELKQVSNYRWFDNKADAVDYIIGIYNKEIEKYQFVIKSIEVKKWDLKFKHDII